MRSTNSSVARRDGDEDDGPGRPRLSSSYSAARSGVGPQRIVGDDALAPHVLLAEDNPEMRRLLAGSLRKAGYDVTEVQTGVELVRALATQLLHTVSHRPVDLVISDLRMPGPSGLDVLAGLRASDWATPFILITAFGSDDVHLEALREGAAAVFNKPFDLEDLRAAVVNLIGKAKP